MSKTGLLPFISCFVMVCLYFLVYSCIRWKSLQARPVFLSFQCFFCCICFASVSIVYTLPVHNLQVVATSIARPNPHPLVYIYKLFIEWQSLESKAHFVFSELYNIFRHIQWLYLTTGPLCVYHPQRSNPFMQGPLPLFIFFFSRLLHIKW